MTELSLREPTFLILTVAGYALQTTVAGPPTPTT